MKTLRLLSYLLVVTLFSVSFVSCSDDDDEPDYSALIVGTWQMSYSKGWENYNGEEDTWDKPDNDVFWMFHSDGSGYWYELGYEDDKENIKWSISGNVLKIDSDTFIIKELTADKLVTYIIWDETNYKGESTDTFRKIK